jgi:DNA primase catalytic core
VARPAKSPPHPARGLWYCFSCAEGGDVIKFVQKIDSLSFVEAVEHLAGRAGLDLRYEQGGQVPGREHSQRRRLIEAHKAAAEFFTERLHGAGAAAARAFLAERGFEQADGERFGVGYAPAEWEALTKHLRGRGFTEQELLAGGLATQGRRGAMAATVTTSQPNTTSIRNRTAKAATAAKKPPAPGARATSCIHCLPGTPCRAASHGGHG